MKRAKLVAGNWKMHGSLAANRALVTELLALLPPNPDCDIVVCPPAVYLAQVSELLRGDARVQLGAQDVAAHEPGPFTGDVCAGMLQELGVDYCIIGHSERRRHQEEGDWLIAQKAQQALDCGITPIVCLGETARQREHGWAEWVVGHQLDALVRALGPRMADVVLAYEPIWAIGSGQTATPAQAQHMHAALRAQVAAAGAKASDMRILYGGSMKPANATALLAEPDIDGGLVGGASLIAADFAQIIAAASRPQGTATHTTTESS